MPTSSSALRELLRGIGSDGNSPELQLHRLNHLAGYGATQRITVEQLQQANDKVKDTAVPSSDALPKPLPRDSKFDSLAAAAFSDFRDRERRFLLGLSDKERKVFFDGYDIPATIAAVSSRLYLEFFLTLKGAKPCMMAWRGFSDGADLLFNRRVVECLAPVIDEFHLEDYGFSLVYITNQVIAADDSNFRGGWVFVDTLSSAWELVRDMFLTVHPAEHRFTDLNVALALGYPIREDGLKDKNMVSYNDITEMEVLLEETGDERIGGVDSFRYFVTDAEFESLEFANPHFEECRKLAESVGTVIKLGAFPRRVVSSAAANAKDGHEA